MTDPVTDLIDELALPPGYVHVVDTVHRPVAARLAEARARIGRPLVVGVCGSQASGKTTLAAFVKALLTQQGLTAETLAIDDLYLSRRAREEMARTVHPLFVTRGPPGTHDILLGQEILDVLTGARPAGQARMPRFDKAADNLAPVADWPPLAGAVDVVLFEGWCVGAGPQPEAELEPPVNDMERDLDAEGVWRRYVNDRLGGDYAGLFARIDLLVMLKAPSFGAVFAWRTLQEHKLGERLRAEGADMTGRKLMTPEELRFFLAHYQRLTEHILAEMPGRANMVVELEYDHAVKGLTFR